ncbi:MAG: sigma-70 region 4 domain-containing protein [Nanoarchaeota archaeon]
MELNDKHPALFANIDEQAQSSEAVGTIHNYRAAEYGVGDKRSFLEGHYPRAIQLVHQRSRNMVRRGTLDPKKFEKVLETLIDIATTSLTKWAEKPLDTNPEAYFRYLNSAITNVAQRGWGLRRDKFSSLDEASAEDKGLQYLTGKVDLKTLNIDSEKGWKLLKDKISSPLSYQVFEMQHRKGYSGKEIARILGVPLQTVQNRQFVARRDLRTHAEKNPKFYQSFLEAFTDVSSSLYD